MAMMVIVVSDEAEGQVGVTMHVEPVVDVDNQTPAQIAAAVMLNAMHKHLNPEPQAPRNAWNWHPNPEPQAPVEEKSQIILPFADLD